MSEDKSSGLKNEIHESAGPIVRFVGHALAVALGVVLLTPVLLIPIGVVKLLGDFGFKDLESKIQTLEVWLLYSELAFFAVTLLIGAFSLLACEVLRAATHIRVMY